VEENVSRVRVKICGITSVEDARLAVEAGADAIGLIFAESPRQVDRSQALHIIKALPPWVTSVASSSMRSPRWRSAWPAS